MRHFVIAAFFLTLTLCAGEKPANLIMVKLGRAEDAAVLAHNDGKANVEITSKGGIGSAKLTRTGKDWPKSVTVQLNLAHLELLRMNNGQIQLSTSVVGPPKETPYTLVANKREIKGGKRSGKIDVEVLKKADRIVITVPAEIFKDNPQNIEISWIDFYRN